MLTLGALLSRTAERHGDRVFLVDLGSGESSTYRQVDRAVNGLAHGLRDLGVGAGDRVAAVLDSSPRLLTLWLATARLGAVLVPLNPALTPRELTSLLEHAGPRLLVGGPADAPPASRDGRVLGAADLCSLLVPRNDAPPAAPSRDDPLTILYTSGTTGRPKGCLLTHRSYVLPQAELGRRLALRPEDRLLGCLPVFHMAGQSFAAAALRAGASLAMVPRFSATRFWSQVERSRATVFRYLGEMLALLCLPPPRPGDRAHSLRVIYGGGARPDVAAAFERRFGVPVVEGYGLTETNTVACNDLRARRAGSIGRPLPHCDVRIADEEGRALGPGETGEIQVRRNPALFREYFRAPELTHDALAGDWYRTGDLGARDADGYLYFAGRRKDVIRRRGENVDPAEVEEVLDRHPAVALSAVVGLADQLGSEEVGAFVVPRAGSDLRAHELIDWCRSRLAPFKVPSFLELAPALPLTPTSKVDKGLLRRSGTAGRTRRV